MSLIIILFICSFLLFANNLFAVENDSLLSTKKASNIRVQYAGNLGLVSIGFDRDISHSRIKVGMSYGYLPRRVNGAQVHTFALRSSGNLWDVNIPKIQITPYIGSNITYSHTAKTYTEYPSYFPSNYHLPNAVHFNPFIGVRIGPQWGIKPTDFFLFTELGSIDYLIWYEIKNRDIELDDIVNLSFGFSIEVKDHEVQKR